MASDDEVLAMPIPNVSFDEATLFPRSNQSFGRGSFNGKMMNASFGSQAALEVTSELKNMSFGSPVNKPLPVEWQFWFDHRTSAPPSDGESTRTASPSVDREDSPTARGQHTTRQGLGVFGTIKLFWWFYHKLAPEAVPHAIDSVHLFKTGIEPIYSHQRNRKGGHYRMVCKTKGDQQKLWLDVCLHLIGAKNDIVCGVGYDLTKRHVSVWLEDAEDEEGKKAIRKQLVSMMNADTQIQFKDHASLLTKESALTLSMGLIDNELTAPATSINADQAGKRPNCVARELGLIPPGQMYGHRISRSCPEGLEDVVDALEASGGGDVKSSSLRDRPGLLKGNRPRSETSVVRLTRGRSLSRAYISTASDPMLPNNPQPLRRTLSTGDVESHIPVSSIRVDEDNQKGMRNVASWADDSESEVYATPAADNLDVLESPKAAGELRTAFFQDNNYPLLSEPLPAGVRPQAGHQVSTSMDWDFGGSGPPSLAHSGPASPANQMHMQSGGPDRGMLAAHFSRLDEAMPSPPLSPTHYSSSHHGGYSPVSNGHPHTPHKQFAVPGPSPDQMHAQLQAIQQQAAAAARGHGPAGSPGHGPAAAPHAYGNQGGFGQGMQSQFGGMFSGGDARHMNGINGQSPQEAAMMQGMNNWNAMLLKQQQQQHQQQQPGAHMGGAQGLAMQQALMHGMQGMPGVHGGGMHQGMMSQQILMQQHGMGMGHMGVRAQGHMGHGVNHPGAVGGKLAGNKAAAAAAAKPAGRRSGVVQGGLVGVIYGSGKQPANPMNIDPQRILETMIDIEEDEEDEETASNKFSKSRSPRNRRKIRERKIREAAEAAKKEMDVWCPMYGAPKDAWVAPLENLYLPMLQGFSSTEWYRFVQACKKEKILLGDLHLMPPDVLEKLGAETPTQVKAVQECILCDGPAPNPLIALHRKVQQQEGQNIYGGSQAAPSKAWNYKPGQQFLAPPTAC